MPKVRALAALISLVPALLATAPPLRAQASLVADLATGAAADGSSNPSGFTTAGGKLFFFASESSTGRELYRTDGTGAGTELLADLCPGPCGGGRLLALADLDGTLLFGNFFGLARSDGTRAGTYSLNDATGVPLLLDPNRDPRVAVLGHFGYLEIFDFQGAHTIWRTDGTQAGTRPLSALLAGLPDTLWSPAAVGSNLYFFAPASPASPDGPGSLWRSDGTPAGTGKVADLPFRPRYPTAVAGRLLFASPAGQIWGSDGTAAGTRQLSSFTSEQPLGNDPGLLPVSPFRVLGGSAYFAADDGTHGKQIWASDGTPAGTRLFTPLTTATVYDSYVTTRMELAGSRLVFEATDTRLRPWASDGTAAGTVPLADVTLNVNFGLLRVAGRVLFAEPPGATGEARIWTTDGTPAGTAPLAGCGGPCTTNAQLTGLLGDGYFLSHGALWRTDGSPSGAGTRRLTDFDRVDTPDSILSPLSLGALPGRVFFPGRSPQYGRELWVTQGTPADNRLVANLAHAAPGSTPGYLTPLGDRLLWNACAGETNEVWSTAGTPGTTVQLTTGGAGCGSFRPIVTTGSTAFFLHLEGGPAGTPRLWKSDGTPAGTTRVDTVPLDDTFILAVFRGKALFTAPAANGDALWQTDGTPAGTSQACVIPTTGIASLDVLGDEIYLWAEDNGQEAVWRSDGTPAGTRKLTTAMELPSESSFVRVGTTVFFVKQDTFAASQQIWKTDGTPEGTVLSIVLRPASAGVSPLFLTPELTELHGTLFFFGFTPTGEGLWRSDGTPAGTALVKEFVFPGFVNHGLKTALGRLFFFATDGVHGYELWQSDGTPEGTVLVKDVLPGGTLTYTALNALPYGITEAGGRVFWTADDGVHGFELWETDGNPANPAGTRLVQDLAPEAASSFPDQLTAAGDRLYFTADDGLSGRELWTLPLSAPAGCQPTDTRLCLAGSRFQVEIAWKDFQGQTGAGHAVALTADTGYFWFFGPANVETVVKVLDARALNGAFWVFYGALSTVEYTMTVTDTQTGLTRRYFNPAGQLASVGDTAGFGPLGAYDARIETPAPAPAWTAAETAARAATSACIPGPTQLCLQGNRFAVTATWKDFQGKTGTGTAVSLSGDTGYFWFFAPTNVEVVTKVLDGTALNGKFWFFYGALSNVEYTLTVTDTRTGAVKTYKNPSGQFGSLADTGAF